MLIWHWFRARRRLGLGFVLATLSFFVFLGGSAIILANMAGVEVGEGLV